MGKAGSSGRQLGRLLVNVTFCPQRENVITRSLVRLAAREPKHCTVVLPKWDFFFWKIRSSCFRQKYFNSMNLFEKGASLFLTAPIWVVVL